jgi:hypothetical protein
MNALENKLNQLNAGLLAKFHETVEEVEPLLLKFDSNFPTYTDHSVKHSKAVLDIVAQLLTKNEIDNLNADEIYILSMGCILHDIGMCVPKESLFELSSKKYDEFENSKSDELKEDFIRDIHHEISYDFILKESELLKIPNENYAEAIALVARGHRKMNLDDNELYPPKYFVKSGRDFVCLPYVASLIRLADELDITNARTPQLLTKYYMPNNGKSIQEWKKHISTTQINFTEDKVIFKVKCSDQNNLAALEEQFEKIQNVANYCQKIIRNISNTDERRFNLSVLRVVPEYKFIAFDPKGIKFSFNVQNVVKTFIGEDLYKNELATLKEAIQNSIDSCRYKQSIYKEDYSPKLDVVIDDTTIVIKDNGLGMDEFIIENFFGRLGSSFYEQEKIKKDYEAIGQFGVGVFAYFLLAEYIDIETKTRDSKALKFRIDKDPQNYFHFFEKPERVEMGTTITLYLKKSVIDNYKSDDYIRYIEDTFRYVEFPIQIDAKSKKYSINQRSFNLNQEYEIEQKIMLQYRSKVSEFQIISCSINNNEYEGECGVIVNQFNNKFSFHDPYICFDDEAFETANSTYDSSQIAICQKGVFVSNYSSPSLSLFIGNINLKKSKKININRTEFSDSVVIKDIIEDFAAQAIDILFQKIHEKYSIEHVSRLSDEFINRFFSIYSVNPQKSKLVEVFKTSLIVRLFDGIEEHYMTIEDLMKNIKRFVFITHLENKLEVFQVHNLPVVIVTNNDYDNTFRTLRDILIKFYNYIPSISFIENKAYQVLDLSGDKGIIEKQKMLENILDYRMLEIQEINSNLVAVSLSKNKKGYLKYSWGRFSDVINANHPLLREILSNYETIKNDAELKRFVRAVMEMLIRLSESNRNILTLKRIKELNSIIVALNKIGVVYQFSKNDFQKLSK